MSTLAFDREFDPQYGEPIGLSNLITRITANNPSPFTFKGTNTFLVGTRSLAIIDPGPDDDVHFQSLLTAIGERPVTDIFITHTHMDHSPLANRLKNVTGAKIYAEGGHRTSRTLRQGEINPLDESSDYEFKPDHILKHGEIVKGQGWTMEAVLTPGHTANHSAYFLKEEETLFAGDHVMAWSTSIVAPPDGSMRDYMASLDHLIDRNDPHILPAHGPAISSPETYLPSLKAHRLARETSIIELIKQMCDASIKEIVAEIYSDLDPKLHSAAQLSVFAHIEDLVERDILITKTSLTLEGRYSLNRSDLD